MAKGDLGRYGRRALVAGASEGIGAAFAERLAAAGYDCWLVARGADKLAACATRLRTAYPGVNITTLALDLAAAEAVPRLTEALGGAGVDVLVYNAAASHIGPFAEQPPAARRLQLAVNVSTPTALVATLAPAMLARRRGAVILLSSLAGFQGTGRLAQYAATKAYLRVLAEGLWYEWRGRGVTALAVCAGATLTPNYRATDPRRASPLAPREQGPAAATAWRVFSSTASWAAAAPSWPWATPPPASTPPPPQTMPWRTA